MSDRLVEVIMHGPEASTSWLGLGLPIPHARHFLVTDLYARHSKLSNLMDIGENPAITHLGTGLRVSQGLKSLDQVNKIAAVLEALPIPWEGTEVEIRLGLSKVPPALRRWLQVEVCGHRESRVPSPGSRATPEAR